MNAPAPLIGPKELGRELGHNDGDRPGRKVRAYLRERYPDRARGGHWLLTPEEADDVRRHFGGASAAASSAVTNAPSREEAYAAVDAIAAWSAWMPFGEGAIIAPRTPGVYMMRRADGPIVYAGMAGERRGAGIYGRLSIYRRGKGAVSGFGEAALDRALADAAFVEQRLDAIREGRPSRAAAWARDAIDWLEIEVRWTECADKVTALALETQVVGQLAAHGIWNRVASV